MLAIKVCSLFFALIVISEAVDIEGARQKLISILVTKGIYKPLTDATQLNVDAQLILEACDRAKRLSKLVSFKQPRMKVRGDRRVDVVRLRGSVDPGTDAYEGQVQALLDEAVANFVTRILDRPASKGKFVPPAPAGSARSLHSKIRAVAIGNAEEGKPPLMTVTILIELDDNDHDNAVWGILFKPPAPPVSYSGVESSDDDDDDEAPLLSR